MIVPVVQIGNSKGIRLPKYILDQFDIRETLDMKVLNEGILFTPVKNTVRSGWAEAFSEMHKNKDDIPEFIPELEDFEWQW